MQLLDFLEAEEAGQLSERRPGMPCSSIHLAAASNSALGSGSAVNSAKKPTIAPRLGMDTPRRATRRALGLAVERFVRLVDPRAFAMAEELYREAVAYKRGKGGQLTESPLVGLQGALTKAEVLADVPSPSALTDRSRHPD